ncbi:uncharacterized protein LOC131843001 [Achroia grisella]|uniref:uncharacterized protein LOC131843001 n=1 Tax=Achroia grisella TaxID=688607 RepID=UPI0027D22025|nr:uncharacterized protein LOC131843001 [Achroia grisella]
MGSAKVSQAKPQLPMADSADKKSIAKIIKKLFRKDKKKDELKKNERTEEAPETAPPKQTTVDCILENMKKLELNAKNDDSDINDEDDELKHFNFKVVEDEGRAERIDSHSSEDSGFSEKVEEIDEGNKEELVESLNNLKIDDGRKQKKLQTVVVSRTPIRNRVSDFGSNARPYPAQSTDLAYRQINQVNKQFFSGGQVIENSVPSIEETGQITPVQSPPSVRNQPDNRLEFDLAIEHVQKTTETSQHEYGQDWLLDTVNEVIDSIEKNSDMDSELNLFGLNETDDINFVQYNGYLQEETTNPIEEFENHLDNDITTLSNYDDVYNLINDKYAEEYCRQEESFVFLTPPHSEEVASPMSDSQASMYRNTSEYTLSPERSSPIGNSDCELFQDIPHGIEQLDYPTCVSADSDVIKSRNRTSSTGSLKKRMKEYKDLQKEIGNRFSKKECCQLSRKPCKTVFQEYMQKLKTEERAGLCLKVAKMDLKAAFGVLQRILQSLSTSSDLEDLQHVLFVLICERVLSQKPALFIQQFGLDLLKESALRCYRRPLLTRYLVQCIRTAIKLDSSLVEGKNTVFHEVDVQGDTLLIACVRIGDAAADVLSELVRRDHDQMPLFKTHHINAEGLSALHVACVEHSAESPRLHATHVLLQHADADIWKGNNKSGDTALHLAVNSRTCDLNLVMLLFRHVDRKMWRKLAHTPNMCSRTPLDYAREATRSQTRQNHPHEVLEFLQKCRN